MPDLFEVTVSVEHEESFDVERESQEDAEEFAEMMVAEDIDAGKIPADSFEIEATAEKVEDE